MLWSSEFLPFGIRHWNTARRNIVYDEEYEQWLVIHSFSYSHFYTTYIYARNSCANQLEPISVTSWNSRMLCLTFVYANSSLIGIPPSGA